MDNPALIFFNSDGHKYREEWYKNGLINRNKNPAVKEYYYGKSIKRVKYRLHNLLHGDSNSELILYDNKDLIKFLFINISILAIKNSSKKKGSCIICHCKI
jgi:hypothetical protein